MAQQEPSITKPKRYSPISFWVNSHMRAILSSFGALMRSPLATLMTVLVFAIAMALPISFITLLHGISPIQKQWQQKPTLTLYLNHKIAASAQTALLSKLHNLNSVESVQYVSPQQGLQELTTQTQLPGSVMSLIDNPLPGAIVVTLNKNAAGPVPLKNLQMKLTQLGGVQSVKVNLRWLERLYFIMNLLHRLAYGLAALLALGLFFVTANTMRLVLQNSKIEVRVLKLVGATTAFIRRPLLYRGFWLGLLGAICAWLLVVGLMTWLMQPLSDLASSYGLSVYSQLYDIKIILTSCLFAAFVGTSAAWFVSSRFLRRAEEHD